MSTIRLLLIASLPLLLVACGGAGRPDPGETARMFGAQGSSAFTSGNLQEALAEYRKAYAAAARADLPLEQAQCLFNIGRVYYEIGLLDSAAAAFLAAYGDFTWYHDAGRASTAAGFIALVNSRRGSYDSAYAWYGRGRPKTLTGNAETAFWLMVQARLCTMNGRVPEAESYLDKAMECCQKASMYGSMAQIEYERAAIAYSSAKYDDARAALDKSLAALDKSPDRYRRWRVLLARATVSFCLRDEEAGARYYTRAAHCVPQGVAALPPLDSVRSCPKQWWEQYR